MILQLENGEKVRVRVVKKGEIYEYFIKDKKIGVYDPKVMEDNILMLQNTIDNEISNQIKDQINSVDKEEIAEEAKLISRIEEYTKIILGIEEVKDVLLVDLEDEKEENKAAANFPFAAAGIHCACLWSLRFMSSCTSLVRPDFREFSTRSSG